jgi:hypothetical protein
VPTSHDEGEAKAAIEIDATDTKAACGSQRSAEPIADGDEGADMVIGSMDIDYARRVPAGDMQNTRRRHHLAGGLSCAHGIARCTRLGHRSA